MVSEGALRLSQGRRKRQGVVARGLTQAELWTTERPAQPRIPRGVARAPLRLETLVCPVSCVAASRLLGVSVWGL